jgi:tetratricopeptide (TPR) repeat protein
MDLTKVSQRQRLVLCTFALILIALTAYANVYHFDFLFDDEFLIQKNLFLRSWASIGKLISSCSTAGSGGVDSFFRPVQGLLYLIVYQISGLNSAGYHLLNILFHAGNGVLMFLIARSIGLRTRYAFLSAAIWLAHPVHTEAITYMSATADSTYTFFCLLGVFLLARNPNRKGTSWACVAFILGLLSKESAIVFPALALGIDCLSRKEKISLRAIVRTAPFWIIGLFYVISRKTVLDFDQGLGFYKTANIYSENLGVRIATFLATLPSYAKVFIWPSGLHMERTFPVYTSFVYPEVVLGGFIATAFVSCLVAFFFFYPSSVALFGISWFAIAHAPHTGVVLPVNSLFLEHWLYLPSIGIMLTIAALIQKAPTWLESRQSQRHTPIDRPRGMFANRMILIASVSLLLVLLASTLKQNRVWKDPITFYSYLLEHGVKSARINNNLAMAYSEKGADDLAIQNYLAAIALSDTYPQTQHNLGLLYAKHEDFLQATIHLRRAIEINRDFYYSYGALSEIYTKIGASKEAQEYEAKYLEIKSRFVH